jgi:hypothetical protein
MNAPSRKPLTLDPLVIIAEEVRGDPVEVFRLRCHSRAKLWHDGEIDLHSAVDELQHSAEASGLIGAIGQDAVQGLMVEAFAPLRDDLPKRPSTATVSDDPWSAPGWRDAAIDYHEARNGRVSVVSYSADELERLRRLMADDISIERADREIKAERLSRQIPEVVLHAAEYLLQQGDADRWRKWFDSRSPAERAAILQHLEKGRRGT